MTDSLIHFPLYVGDAFKKFIEYPSLEERVQKLENAVYKDKSFTEEEINPDNIPF